MLYGNKMLKIADELRRETVRNFGTVTNNVYRNTAFAKDCPWGYDMCVLLSPVFYSASVLEAVGEALFRATAIRYPAREHALP